MQISGGIFYYHKKDNTEFFIIIKKDKAHFIILFFSLSRTLQKQAVSLVRNDEQKRFCALFAMTASR